MSSTLDLSSASQLFYGSTEVGELRRDGVVLWQKPGWTPPAPSAAETVFAGYATATGASPGALSIVVPLSAPFLTEGRAALTFSTTGNSFGMGVTPSNMTLTPLDGAGAALGPAVAMTRQGFFVDDYAGASAFTVEGASWPAGAVSARVDLDASNRGKVFNLGVGLYDLVGFSGLTVACEGIAPSPVGTGGKDYSFVSPIGEALFLAQVANNRPDPDSSWTSTEVVETFREGDVLGAKGRGATVDAYIDAEYMRLALVCLFITP